MKRGAVLRAWPALLLIAGGAIVAAAYVLDAQESNRTVTAKASPAPEPAAVQSSTPVSHPQVPASHPPVAKPPPGADAREGKITVDPVRPFAHFRVGNNSVVALYADGPVMWLGGSGGIVRYNAATREFKTYVTRDGLRSNAILDLGKLQNRISVGTYGGGLSLLDQDRQEWEHYGAAEGLGDNAVFSVLEATNADVWIATGAGVHRVRGGAMKERAKWERYTVASTAGGLPHDRVYRIAEGRDGSVWFATRGGVANFRNGKWMNWTHAKGLGAARESAKPETAAKIDPTGGPVQDARGAGEKATPDHVAAVAVGEDGMVWAGTRGAGLSRFDGKAWRNYGVAEGLPSNQVFALHFDRKGRLWVGTESGLAVFSNGRFQVMTTAHGLLAESVFAVTTTDEGDAWVGGFGGVAQLRRPDPNKKLPPASPDPSLTTAHSK